MIVVDNDPDGSAETVVDEFRASAAGAEIEVRYALEPTPGIAAARNAAVALARDRAAIAFIDDDEVPDANWLAALVAARERYDADVVAGPAYPVFAPGTPDWVRRSRFFDPPTRVSGQSIRQAGTNNMLIRLAALDGMPEPFDPEFGLAGAEDTLLCLRLHAQGRRLVWDQEAATYEDVPVERANARYLVRRALRTDNSGALCELLVAPGAQRRRLRIRIVGQGLRMLLTGIVAGPVLGGLWSRVNWVRALRLAARGVGRVAGACGWRYLEYGRGRRRWVLARSRSTSSA